MNKTSTLIITALLFTSLFPAFGNDSRARQMKIGYTEGDLCLSLGTEVKVITKGAMQFPASYLNRLKGNKIVKIRLGIGADLTEQENSLFITRKLDEEPICSQTVAQLKPGWNEITLEHPVEITGEELFIGYRYVTAGPTVSFDGGQTSSYGNWISFGEKEEGLTWNHQEDCGNLNIEAIVEGDQLPQNDAALFSVFSKKYAQSAHTYPIECLVRNTAATDITSLEVTYALTDQKPVTKTINGLCIKSNEIARVHVDDAIIPENGIYDLNITIDKVNGKDDETESDNRGILANIICKDEYTRHKVLLEQFSTELCNNCPAAHKVFEKNLKFSEDEVIWLIHHSGFYTDDLTIEESKSYVYFYNAKSTYAPAAMLDRTNLAQFGALDGDYKATTGPVFNTSSELIPKLLNHQVNTPALVTVDINNTFDTDKRLLNVTVSGEIPSGSADRLKGNDIRLNVYLLEDSIPGAQSGIEGTYIHNHAIRKALTDTWGDKLDFTGGKYHSKEYSFTVPTGWKEKKMRIVAFVANSDKGNPNNGQLFNAEETELIPSPGTAVHSAQATPGIEVYTVSDDLFIDGDYTSAAIYSITGNPVQLVNRPEHKVSVSQLADGIYLIRLKVNGSSIVRKFLKH